MGLEFGYVILDTHWNNFYEESIPIGAVEVCVLASASGLPKQGLELTSFHFISFFCFTCMHMLLFSSSKADFQLQSDLPIQLPCSKAEQKCLSSFLILHLSPFSSLHACTCFLFNSSIMCQLAPSEIIAGKPPNFTHYVGYKVSCSWGEAHG
ncbi:hypothetical protein ACE6H2_006692 [Prunus campanulata]